MKIKELLKKHLFKILFVIIIILIITIYYSFNLNKYFDINHLTKEKLSEVKIFLTDYYFFGPMIIILLFIIFNMAMLPTFFFIFLSGYLYGFLYGSLFSWIGMILGLTTSFLTTRYLFKKDFNSKFGNLKAVKTIEKYI